MIYSFLFAIFMIVLSIILESSGYTMSRRRRLPVAYLSGRQRDRITFRNNAPFSNWLRKTLRRRKALKKVKNFLVKKDNSLILKNRRVMINYHKKKRNIICIDVNNMKNSVSVNFADNEIRGFRYITNHSELKEEFDRFFDTLCVSFNDSVTYDGVATELKKQFNVHEKIAKKEEKTQKPQQQNKTSKKKAEQLNINDATEEQLTKLPGVSVVQAKKAINRINMKGDFKSIEEFFIEMKIKPNFQKQLRKLIFTSPHKVIEKNNDDDDRIIDL